MTSIRHPQKIDRENLLPKVWRRLDKRQQAIPTCAIHKHVYSAKLTKRNIAQPNDLIAVCDVGLNRNHAPITVHLCFFTPQIGNHNLCAGFSKRLYDGAADSAGAARHDH